MSDVILAGHSYGGMVITGVADRATDRIGHLVCHDAATPVNGQSLTDVSPPQMKAARGRGEFVDGQVMSRSAPDAGRRTGVHHRRYARPPRLVDTS